MHGRTRACVRMCMHGWQAAWRDARLRLRVCVLVGPCCEGVRGLQWTPELTHSVRCVNLFLSFLPCRCLLKADLEDSLPYNDYLEYFGPDYRLHFTPSNMENQNDLAADV